MPLLISSIINEPIAAAAGKTGKPKRESISDTEKPKANGTYHSCYYMKPTIEQLAARERADPGYIGRVKDFVVGRDGAGSIRFLGEIDLRGLELESFIEIVPGGRITLKGCVHNSYPGFKDTAEMTTMVTTMFTHEEMCRHDIQALVYSNSLSFKKTVEDKGFEFVSYNPIAGEYKWRTKYFSRLGLIAFKGKQETSNEEMTMVSKAENFNH
ncbi:hypothetical protein L6452_04593 [Arctium lappa]|uniref:Uncharacterized protein n=1 Tax=Arctium lappa TaxID=4217 RepID=A0ACB9EEE4_ARCLA|nr:hypothetical protein L6452_04593 [Arctium lappa]